MAVRQVDLKTKLKEVARKRGAVAFGVASVDDADALKPVKITWGVNAYTKKLRSSMPTARSVILFGIASQDDADELQITRSKGSFEWPGYTRLGLIARDIIRVLRETGYKAGFPSELASYKRIAQLAGIGSFGKHTLIINEKYGPWLRLEMVLTDAPLEPDKPFDENLCGRCDRCVRACPMKALEPYVINPDRCLVAAAELDRIPPSMKKAMDRHSPLISPNTRVMCTICQKACRYTSAERRRNSISVRAKGRNA